MIDTNEPYIDVQDVVWALIDSLELPEIQDEEQVGEYPGTDLASKLPYIAVETIAGARNLFESDAIVDIDVFSATRGQAKKLAGDLSLALLRYPRSVQVGSAKVTIDEAVCTSLPAKRPWEDEKIRRQSATYSITVRR